MKQDSSKILVDSTKRLLRRDANRHLKKIVNKTHAADLSIVFRSLSLADQYRLFNLIEDNETKGVLFSELEEDILLELVDGLKLEELVEEVELMLQERQEKEMPAEEIGQFVMQKLHALDKVAYVRFASVYRDFKDVVEFKEELEKILKEK